MTDKKLELETRLAEKAATIVADLLYDQEVRARFQVSQLSRNDALREVYAAASDDERMQNATITVIETHDGTGIKRLFMNGVVSYEDPVTGFSFTPAPPDFQFTTAVNRDLWGFPLGGGWA